MPPSIISLLNVIELVWAGLKNYVHDKSVNFSFSDVRRLAYQWMTSLNRAAAMEYINETVASQKRYFLINHVAI